MLVAEYGERLDQKGRDYVERMRRSVLKMAQLIDDLLAYARVERREFQFARITLAPFIDDLLAEQRDDFERYGAQVTKQIAAVTVRADIEGLGMAIRNLLQNALKFSRNAQPPRIEVNVIAGDDGVLITVRDNGIGFDMNYHERIFEMFQRLHRAEEFPGTGIGLAIVRKGVERMSGRVWATSKPGDGATFHLLLPAGD
jgi:signal transduction histidine kinase